MYTKTTSSSSSSSSSHQNKYTTIFRRARARAKQTKYTHRMQASVCFSSSWSPSSLVVVLLVQLLPLLLLSTTPTASLAWAPVSRTITVDWRGRGDVRTVQSAVDSVPDGNRDWIKIHVIAGTYWEKVSIPKQKGYILLEGEGPSATAISFNAHAPAGIDDMMRRPNFTADKQSPTFRSATFTVLADNFVARGITFKNTYRVPYDELSRENQAVAALVGGDKSAFYGCAFHGFQDTLCDFQGRHYFRGCTVRGAVDFVFGFAQSIYEDCALVSVMPRGRGRAAKQPGWVTAHSRANASSPGGLVFKGGQVRGHYSRQTYLGRAWNAFAAVVFYRTRMDNVVVPQGWQAWKAAGEVASVTFAEVECTGPGAEMSRRVGWEKRLSEEEVQRFVDIKFIDDDGWLSDQP